MKGLGGESSMGEFFLKLMQMMIISIIKPFAEALAKKLFEQFSKKGKGKPTLASTKRKKGGKSN